MEIWKGKMSKVFIHESAILRKRDFNYVEVSLCCLDYEGGYKLGYLGADSKETLSSIINSDVYVEIRNNHLKGKFLEKCKSCDMPRNKDHIKSR